MNHALIIDDNLIVSRAIQSCLENLGFASFDHTWTEAQALDAARRRTPDLIVVGDELEFGSALDAARRISEWLSVPVLMVTGDPGRARQHLAQVEAFSGPFLLNQIEEAVEIARSRLVEAPVAEARTASASGLGALEA